MKLNRILTAAVAAALALTAHAELPNGIASGDVAQNSAVLWARSDTAGLINFRVATDPGFTNIVGTGAFNITDPTIPVKINQTGLSAGTQYYFDVKDASPAAAVAGSFRTPAASGFNGLRFGASGDWRGDTAPFPALNNAASRNLDLFIKLGDTVYHDIPSPAFNQPQAFSLGQMRTKYNEVYSSQAGLNAFANLQRNVPVLTTLDDHEVTNDFAGYQNWEVQGQTLATNPFAYGGDATPNVAPALGTKKNRTPLYQNGIQTFQEYTAISNQTYSNIGDDRTDGVAKIYRNRNYGKDAAIITLDARSFRDAGLPAADPTSPASITNFLVQSFTPGRTMLGGRQLADLKADLLAAQNNGTTWKFVNLPEPIQNLGVVGASDRYEGYAAERTELLSFIKNNNIQNVVFVAADIHGTVVNDVSYQAGPGQPQIKSGAFEITTGSVAFDQPFGPTVYNIALSLGLVPAPLQGLWNTGVIANREFVIKTLINAQVEQLGYSPVGLEDSGLNATLLQGGYTATNTYGWTEFDINPTTQALTVTTYGIPGYASGQGAANVGATPVIVSQFVVNPIPEPTTLGVVTLGALALLRRRR